MADKPETAGEAWRSLMVQALGDALTADHRMALIAAAAELRKAAEAGLVPWVEPVAVEPRARKMAPRPECVAAHMLGRTEVYCTAHRGHSGRHHVRDERGSIIVSWGEP